MINVEPMPGFVQIKTDAVKVGSLDTSSRESAVEMAEVVSIGDGVNQLSVGDKVFVKSWGVDIINYEGEWYKFVHIDSKSILGKINV